MNLYNKQCGSDGMYFLIEFNLVGRGQTNDCSIVTTTVYRLDSKTLSTLNFWYI